jgi:hypothetical protein
MEKINSQTDLRNAILHLESERAEEGMKLREQLCLVYDSAKPVNLVKSVIKDAVGSHDVKSHLLNAAVSMTAGYLSKRLVVSEDSSPFVRLLGALLSLGVTIAVARNPEAIKEFGLKILNRISGNPEESEDYRGLHEGQERADPIH